MSIFPTTILLATDGSRHAELARSAAVDLANLANSTDSELHLVTVAPGYPSYDVRSPSVLELLRRQAEDTLNDQAKKVEQEGGKVAGKHLRIAERYRAQKIVQVAEDIEAGLIVMGNRGLGGIRRALIGSISDSVMPTAPSWWCVRQGVPAGLSSTPPGFARRLVSTAAAPPRQRFNPRCEFSR